MKRQTLAGLLKGIVVLIFLIGALFYVVLIPDMIKTIGSDFPEFKHLVNPLIVAIEISALPIIIALISFWGLLSMIARDNSFCSLNAKRLSIIAVCAFSDTVYCFLGMAFLSFQNALSGNAVFFGLLAMVIGVAITVAASLLSHLVEKVRIMQEDVDLTI